MQDKKAYYEQIEAEINRWDDKISKLKDNTKNVNEGVKTQYYEQVEDLMALSELAKQKLQELKEYGDEHWQDFKAGMDAAMENLSKSYDKISSHFTQV